MFSTFPFGSRMPIVFYHSLYNNKINAHVLIGQSAMFYCAGKRMEKSRAFWIII